jgi:tRNA(fMet)-specific endonuclease VapC
MIVADTDVLIDFLAGREPSAGAVGRALQRQELATTAISRYELMSGARNPEEGELVSGFLKNLRVYPLDTASADRAAEVFRSLEEAGQRIDTGDCLIAGIVLHQHGVLLTRNKKHFERVRGLRLA